MCKQGSSRISWHTFALKNFLEFVDYALNICNQTACKSVAQLWIQRDMTVHEENQESSNFNVKKKITMHVPTSRELAKR